MSVHVYISCYLGIRDFPMPRCVCPRNNPGIRGLHILVDSFDLRCESVTCQGQLWQNNVWVGTLTLGVTTVCKHSL